MAARTTPKRPTSLRVGYIDFTVEYLEEADWEAQGFPDSDGGQTNGSQARIVIRQPEKQHEIHTKEILLHEILHAVFYSSGLTIEGGLRQVEDIEEHVVGRLSPVLLQTLRDNPELAAYLQS